MLPLFMEAISQVKISNTGKILAGKGKKNERKLHSLKLTIQLQRLFAYLTNSNRKAIDTTSVTDEIVDENGNPVRIHEQKDVGEFNINFLARINEALELGKENSFTKISNELDPDAKKQQERSIALGMSVSLPVDCHQLSKSFIYNTFFGSFLIITKANDKNGKPIELKANTTFGQIIINSHEKDIYKGWEKNYYSEIDDFQTSTVIL